MTDEQTQALVKECGLDWHRGYIPLFDGDTTNRYAVLVEATIEKFLNDSGQYLTNDATREAAIAEATDPLLERIAELTEEVERFRADALNEKAARRELEAKLAQRVPDGWKLVPVEPTYKMLNAASLATECEGMVTTPWLRKTIYFAMLSASPAAPEQQEPTDSMGIPVSCGKPLCSPGDHHPLCAQASNAQQAEPAKTMTAHRAAYFIYRFLNEEKLLGPNEQAALKFTIEALEAMEAQQAEAQEPVAWANFTPEGNVRIWSKKPESANWCGLTLVPLFTRPQPAQLQRLSAEEVRDAINANGMTFDATDLRIAEYVTDALAAKNGVNLK